MLRCELIEVATAKTRDFEESVLAPGSALRLHRAGPKAGKADPGGIVGRVTLGDKIGR